jgi:alpha-galactosidase
MKQVRAWGFDYLKLDFLYGGALKGKRYKEMPREAAYRECLLMLREAMGADAFFLTCGTPIIPALGTCDAIRVGPDVAHKWESYRDAILLYNPTTPGTKNAIRTVANRLWLKPLAHLDPDVAYFAEKENGLTHEQKELLQDLAYAAEFKATSDLPQWLTPEERERVREFLVANPNVKPSDHRYLFHIDDRLVDFSEGTSLPTPPRGLEKLWGNLLGWLGDFHFVLRIFKLLDDNTLKKRRDSLRTK